MAWLLLAVALGLGVGMVIILYGYRASVIGGFVVLALVLGFIIWYAEFHTATGPDLIGNDEVRLDNFTVKLSYGNSYKITGRLFNKSERFTVAAVGVVFTASDCVDREAETECVVVGERDREIQVEVPAQQARDIVQQLLFPPIRPQGELRWNYRITFVKAA